MVREQLVAPVHSLADALALGEQLAASPRRGRSRRRRGSLLPRTQDRPSRIAAHCATRGVEVIELREGETGTDLTNTIPQMLLFPSSGSVAAARPYLEWLRGQAVRPLVAAMGAQSGAAASAAGFAPDIVAPEASIEAFVAAVAQRLEAQ